MWSVGSVRCVDGKDRKPVMGVSGVIGVMLTCVIFVNGMICSAFSWRAPLRDFTARVPAAPELTGSQCR